MYKVYLLAIALQFTLAATAQQNDSVTYTTKVVGRMHDGGIELRWYPASALYWRKGSQHGYTIERMEIGSGQGYTLVTTMLPLRKADWKGLTAGNDELLQATEELLFNPSPMPAAKGTMAQVLNWENEENGNFLSFMVATNLSPKAAQAAGLTYTDMQVVAGRKYMYRVSLTGMDAAYKNMAGTCLVVADNVANDVVPAGLRAVEGEGTVQLFWDYAYNRTLFTAYQVERSADGGRTFAPLHKTPLLFTLGEAEEVSYTDSVSNYKPYTYRLRGLTPFGNWSEPAAPVAAMGRDLTPATPVSEVNAAGDRKKINISWKLPQPSTDMDGIFVARGPSLNGPFASLHTQPLGIDARSFADNTPLPREPYYLVMVRDTAGNLSNSFAIMATVQDNDPPAIPALPTGLIDSTGVVNLHWPHSKDEDLMGYHIYRSNGKEDVYLQLTGHPVRDTFFTDSISMRALTKDVHYKISAIDYNNNASVYSPVASLKRPDLIAPAAPSFTHYALHQGKVQLKWAPSSSSDVVYYELVRSQAPNHPRWQQKLAADVPNSYTDSSITVADTYTYSLCAVDESGLRSETVSITVNAAGLQDIPTVQQLKADWNARQQSSRISWRYNHKDEYNFLLLRTDAQGILRPLALLEKNSNSYNDEGVAPGTYGYAIKVIFSNGAESALSATVPVVAHAGAQ